MRQVTKLLALLAVVLLTTVSAKAYDFAVDGIYYKITSEEQRNCYVTYGDASYTSNSITIPASVTHNGTTYTVTGIGDYAFANCKSLQSIAIGKVTEIKSYAFVCCESLTAIDLGNVTSIGESAFNACTALRSIDLKNVATIGNTAFTDCTQLVSASMGKVSTISAMAFANCNALTQIDLKDAKVLGNGAFTNCTALTNIDMKSVETIGDLAFKGCSSLVNVNFRNATTIGMGAFANCSALETVILPNVTTIGNGAFLRCNLTEVELPSVQTIYDSAFSENALLSVVKLGKNALTIGAYAFKQCTLLSDIDLSNATSIGHDAFYKCESLKAVDIVKVEELGNSAFKWCKLLSTVKSPKLKSVGDGCFQNCFALETIDLSHVATIGEHAFDNCQKLDNINLDNVESIGISGFSFCISLRSIILRKVTSIKEDTFVGNNLTEVRLGKATNIENGAFALCNSLENIDLSNIETIGDNAFNNCPNLTSVLLGKGLKSIGNSAFASCPKLMEVKILAIIPPTLNYTSFYGRYETCIVYVPIGTASVYKADAGWGQFVNIREQLGLSLNETDIVIGVGKTAQLSVEIIPDDAEHGAIVWFSSASAIATVSADGVVTGISEGTAYINVTCGGAYATCAVTVSNDGGVDDVTTDDDGVCDVYNIQGVLVRSHCDKSRLGELPCGIYIVKSAQGIRKIRI